jgi:FlaA1/EpsC-like NDP-sugar epimerase
MPNSSTVPVTDDRMTRFMITLEQGVELVWTAFEDMVGGEIYVKKIPSMKISDVATACLPKAKHDIIGIRPGEKLHEQMISPDDAPHTFSYGKGIPVGEDFEYSSNTNTEWMSVKQLQEWIEKNRLSIGTI